MFNVRSVMHCDADVSKSILKTGFIILGNVFTMNKK